MAKNEKVFIHFEKKDYISGKVNLLNLQKEVIEVKKMLKNYISLRNQRLQQISLLENCLIGLGIQGERLDKRLPLDRKMEDLFKNPKKSKGKNYPKEVSIEKKNNRKKGSKIEMELLRIQEKLSSLGMN